MFRYFATLPASRQILWCYLIWYVATLLFHFDPSPKLWLNSLGIAAIVGSGLRLSVKRPGVPLDFWALARLYLMPFAVSSFAALIKDRGFVLIFSPSAHELAWTIGACLAFVVLCRVFKHLHPTTG